MVEDVRSVLAKKTAQMTGEFRAIRWHLTEQGADPRRLELR
jgi:hypothetical protein